MRCINCGTEIPNDQRFCGYCGAPQPTSSRTASRKGAKSGQSPAKSRTWIFLGAGASSVIACVVCVVALLLLPWLYERVPEPDSQLVELLTPSATTSTEVAETPTPTFTATPTEIVPTLTPSPTDTPIPDISFRGVSFSYDRSLANEIQPEIVPSVGEPALDIAPEHIRFSFEDYPHLPAFHEPRLLVFPVEAYANLSPQAAERVVDLRNLLQEKPRSVSDEIPFLPFWNAAQILRTNPVYLQFQGGSGVRFLTQYGQAAWPVNNFDLFYTCQGLSQDGRYYIAAIFPVSHPELPADGEEYIGDDWMSFELNFTEYLEQIEFFLNAQSETRFTPDLSSLDAMIESLAIP